MITTEVTEAYAAALKQGTREAKECAAQGKSPNPAVLDELADLSAAAVQEVGLVEIPTERIVGTRAAGRISAFSPTFRPLLGPDTEFAAKWKQLCVDHLGDTGIREPIVCYEYLGDFYVQEGNKRVSVLRHFGAARIPGEVKRVLPPKSDEPRIAAYYEFLEFYRASGLYTVQFRRPGDYAKLTAAVGKEPGEPWTEGERRTFSAYYSYFRDALAGMKVKLTAVLPEEALLLWLQIYPYAELGRLSAAELLKTMDAMAADMISAATEAVKVETKTVDPPKAGLLTRMITPDYIRVAFIHQLTPAASPWVMGHEDGRRHLEQVLGDKVVCKSYFDANTAEAADNAIAQAVEDGAQLVFTTAPLLSRAAVKAAVSNPKIHFFNCSVDQPYASIRTYYGRIYEAKFITGAVAGAMAQNDRIGYIASYPIFGVPASVNAFALGAQLTNPRAKIELRWSCCEGAPLAELLTGGIRVISNREVPTKDKIYLDFCNYGTYLTDERGALQPLAAPMWVWGKFYENIARYYLSGGKKPEKDPFEAVNYWLGMDSGVIGVQLSDRLPHGVRSLAELLIRCMETGKLDPFARRILDQTGQVRNDGTAVFSPNELIRMDWLCENIIGEIPSFDQVMPMSQAIVRELGVYRDHIPAEKEGPKHEAPACLR